MTRPPTMSGYDDDFFAWTQEQAAALRHLPAGVLGADVDIANIATEIEDLGRRDLREVKSYLKRMIEHLIKIDACPEPIDVPHWRSEALVFRDAAADALSPSLRQLLDMIQVWRQGTKLATRLLLEKGVTPTVPTTCPFTLEDLLSDDFDLNAALARLAATAVDAHVAGTRA